MPKQFASTTFGIATLPLVIIIAFVALATGGFLLFKDKLIIQAPPESAQKRPETAKLTETGTEEMVDKIAEKAAVTPVPEGWKTYKNDAYGFELRYPDTWKISSQNTIGPYMKTWNIITSGNSLQSFNVMVYVFDTPQNFKSNKTVSGAPAEDNSWTGINNSRRLAINPSPTTSIVIDAIRADSEEKRKIAEKVFSSFKFINTPKENKIAEYKWETDIAKWKTYSNAKFGIEFKYPKEFNIYNLHKNYSDEGVQFSIDFYDTIPTTTYNLLRHNIGVTINEIPGIAYGIKLEDPLTDYSTKIYLGSIVGYYKFTEPPHTWFIADLVPTNYQIQISVGSEDIKLIETIVSTIKFTPPK